jgi:two-component system response regulator HydG
LTQEHNAFHIEICRFNLVYCWPTKHYVLQIKSILQEHLMRAEDLRPREMVCEEGETGLPMVGAHRVISLGIPTLARLKKDLLRAVGPQKASIIFTRLGYEWGLAQANQIRQLYDFDSTEEWFKAGSALRRCSGLASEQLETIEYIPEKNHLRFSGVWRDSFEMILSLPEGLQSAVPVCQVLTGLVSGYASRVFEMEILVRETECQAMGASECRFEGRPVEEWGMDLMEVKQYFAVTFLDEELDHTQELIRQAQEDLARQREELRILRRKTYKPQSDEHGIVFRSQAMGQVLLMAEKVAPTNSTVLIQGESGTGKEVLAQFIHRQSGRSEQPFLAVNCAALPPNLLESELFGHKKGAFTGADTDKKGLFVEAGEGTLLLDEVGELPLELQAKLLRALQEKEVRPVGSVRSQKIAARIIAATNQDLGRMVAEGKFREDLYYRLAVFPLNVPSLRERREDLLLLARHFLAKFSKNHAGFSSEAIRRLEAYSWPGNVRELENWVEYAVILAGDGRIAPEHLPLRRMHGTNDSFGSLAADMPTWAELERRYIKQVLEYTGGNRKEAAEILGMSVSTLWRRLKDLNEE